MVQLVKNGAVVKNYRYNAFGEEIGIDENDENPFRYCGEYYDAETGTIYLRARYYNPANGRFTTLDPAMDDLNWYAYCGNEPVGRIDPSGKYYIHKTDTGYEIVPMTWYYACLKGATSLTPFLGEQFIVVVERDLADIVGGTSMMTYDNNDAENDIFDDVFSQDPFAQKVIKGFNLFDKVSNVFKDISTSSVEKVVLETFSRNSVSTIGNDVSELEKMMDSSVNFVATGRNYYFMDFYNGMSLYEIDLEATSSTKGFNKMKKLLAGAYYQYMYYDMESAKLAANNILIYSKRRLEYFDLKLLGIVE